MSDRDLHDILANSHRVNEIHNLAGGMANLLNQQDPLQILHQMARLQRALAIETGALRADVTKLAKHMLESQNGTEIRPSSAAV